MNSYFISYQGLFKGTHIFSGWSALTRPPIKTADDIIEIQDFLLKANHTTKNVCDRIIVLSWKRFED